jgi:hypothetical protein
LIRGWEGLVYLFVGYANGKEEVNHDDGGCICIFKVVMNNNGKDLGKIHRFIMPRCN